MICSLENGVGHIDTCITVHRDENNTFRWIVIKNDSYGSVRRIFLDLQTFKVGTTGREVYLRDFKLSKQCKYRAMTSDYQRSSRDFSNTDNKKQTSCESLWFCGLTSLKCLYLSNLKKRFRIFNNFTNYSWELVGNLIRIVRIQAETH